MRISTSPEDHAILEAAYLKNSKPDKVERTDLVGRVALGEKGVQVGLRPRIEIVAKIFQVWCFYLGHYGFDDTKFLSLI